MEVSKENVKNIYPLSPTQEGMLFHYLAAEDPEAYVQQISYRVHGELDAAKFEAAWNELARRHDILRTAFVHTNTKQPLQVVLKERPLDFTLHDTREMDEARQTVFLDAFRDSDRRTPFNPGRARLMRVTLVRLGATEFEVLWTHHHIITDGWSIGILQRELVEIYRSLCAGKAPELPPAPPYSSYIRYLESLDQEVSACYWRDYLGVYSQTATIPATLEPPADAARRVAEFAFTVDSELKRRITQLAQDSAVTVNTALQALWAVLLARHSGTTDVVFGTVVSGRPPAVEGVERIVGIFVNTVPVRVRVQAALSLHDLLARLQRDFVEREPHQYFPLARVQAESALKQNLLSVVTAMENYPVEDQIQAVRASEGLGITVDRARVFEHTHYDFLAQFLPGPSLTVKLQYNSNAYTRSSVERIGSHFQDLLAAAVSNPRITVGRLSQVITDASNRQPALVRMEPRRAVHERVELHSAANPDAIAITCDGAEITYGELNRRANRLAHALRSTGVQRETRVGICCDRSVDLVVSMFAVLKAGGAYVPMDPEYPVDRLAYLVADSRVHVVIADTIGARALAAGTTILSPDAAGSAENLAIESNGSQAAYIIYTSGSTGRPKGCVVTHDNASRLLTATEPQFAFGPSDVWTMFHSAAFDFSVWEIWGALAYGGRLVIVPYWVSRSPADFWRLLETERITVLNQTPSAFRQLLAERESVGMARIRLRAVILGGEALNLQSLVPWFETPVSCHARLVNMYGITETTVHVTYRTIEGSDVRAGKGSVIGAAIADLSLHLLDQQMTPVPLGTPGEIYVGGAGVARGYWRRPALTAERFVPDPFGPPGARLYRSGDLARKHENGDFEYLGRADEQVKIRGFRIELGEIESVLSSHPLVREAVVAASPDASGDTRLVAYVAGLRDERSVDELRAALRDKLPGYMVPGTIIRLDKLPLTAHGKVDRKALPSPEPMPATRRFVAPRTPVEEALAAVWSQVLGVPRVGIHDNYLDLGGDSISAIRVVSALLQRHWKVSVRDLFRYPTVAELAPCAQPAQVLTVRMGNPLSGPLSPIQAQFFAEHRVDPHWFNHAIFVRLPDQPDLPRILDLVWGKLWDHHAALRLKFAAHNGTWLQQVGPSSALGAIEYVDVRKASDPQHEITARCNQLQKSFDLSAGPLIRLACFLTPEGPSLFVLIHHLVVDAVSWRILLEDFATGFRQAASGAPVELNAASDSFVRWCADLEIHRESSAFQKALSYWMGIDSDPSPAHIPFRNASGSNLYGEARTSSFHLPRHDTAALLQTASAAYNTNAEDLLLAALAGALCDWHGARASKVLIESHGRDGILEGIDVSRTIGWFTSIYPVLLETPDGADIGRTIRLTKETLRNVPRQGIDYGLAKRDWKSPPESIRFNFLGNPRAHARSGECAVSTEGVGTTVSPAAARPVAIDISTVISDGRLEGGVTFSPHQFDPDGIDTLVNLYRTHLYDVIRHCCGRQWSEVTPSDLTYGELTLDELDRILS